ncbi:hypothetical protein CTAYLR_009530 [Chrysophaeum taylorii]|uniref:Uncharacterized protein n=1 Tax=Chrysophaeum taylorii TaxID=2483200 RepID=A0AAD7UHW8_9STRA|nr:hypothetical protein CTAYLR_009530 [Chrysophaeum taylorii]
MGNKCPKKTCQEKKYATTATPELAWPGETTGLLDCWCLGEERAAVACLDGRVVVVDTTKGTCCEVGRHEAAVNCVVACRGTIYTCSRDRSIGVWGATARRLEGHELNASAVAATERIVASGSRDATVRTWDPERGAQLSMSRIPRNLVTCLRWIPRSSSFAQGSEDLHLRVWDSRRARTPVQTMGGYEFFPLCVDATEHLLATGSKGFDGKGAELRVWDRRATRVPTHILSGHQQDTTGCAFLPFAGENDTNPTERCVVTASKDRSIKIWDLSKDNADRPIINDLKLADAGMYTGLAVAPDRTNLKAVTSTFQGGLACFDHAWGLIAVVPPTPADDR